MSIPADPLMIMYGVLLRSSPSILRPFWCRWQVSDAIDAELEAMAPLPFMLIPDMADELDSSDAAGYVALSANPAASATMPSKAAAGALRITVKAGGSHDAAVAGTSGTMAAASRISSGPVLGSVPEPLNTSPTNPCAATHMATLRTAPAARNHPGRRTTSGPSPITTESSASTHAVCVPEWANWLPRLVRK